MTLSARSFRTLLLHGATAIVLCNTASLLSAQAPLRWTIDPKGSLAWWQIDPNMNHLWGTTCPQEPSWRPGEGRSGGWETEDAMNSKVLHGFSDVSDTIHVPLYPRRRVRFVCTEAITGDFSVQDTVKWRGAQGQLVIKAGDLVTGENMRDVYAKNGVLSVSTYPEISFKLDSLANMVRGRGDTVRGTAMGTWTFRGVTKPISARLVSYPEAGGTRMLAKFGIPVNMLINEYGIWKRTLGLGVYMGIWKTLFMGVDVLMRPEGTGAN